MAHINQINELTQPIGTQAKPKTGEKSNAFDSLLSNALDKTEPADGEAETVALGEISSPGFQLETPSSLVTGKTNSLLELLETYASQLENPGISLKNIAPVLDQINEKADSLLKDTQFLSKEDSELKTIANQTVVTAQTEYLKFQRGDYLS